MWLPRVRLGAPGPFVVLAWLGALLWYPVRWYEDPAASWALTAARAGLWAVGSAVAARLLATFRPTEPRDESWLRAGAALRRGTAPSDEGERRLLAGHLPELRRGARLGLAAGVPLFAALTGAAVEVDRPGSAVLFGLCLVGVVAVAARTLTRVRRTRADLDTN
ncbi:hypothetical protein K7640_04490 [Micromonospora sp. PLK6-60]|uniref:hypothetical protein n=1 Tax=Micromonospora sp. PLK6-60 TaxID=2873383 RepID=UPI001CA64633|nr:hypothetical protein [Micromonospora sp. PLK6-60]MBY8871102.1 hypothetical protein [Micromonospora sp. PLK6-60]